jgi:hypothetical protein
MIIENASFTECKILNFMSSSRKNNEKDQNIRIRA